MGLASATYSLGRTAWQRGPQQTQRLPQVDNEEVAVWTSIIPSGTESGFHRHDRRRLVIGVVGGDLKTVTPAGQTAVTHYETGRAYWQEPMPAGEVHKDVNDTTSMIELVVVEMKK
jgi:hypothetical protein